MKEWNNVAGNVAENLTGVRKRDKRNAKNIKAGRWRERAKLVTQHVTENLEVVLEGIRLHVMIVAFVNNCHDLVCFPQPTC